MPTLKVQINILAHKRKVSQIIIFTSNITSFKSITFQSENYLKLGVNIKI